MSLKIVWIYSKDMNIYGDYGNVLALKKQAELRGLDVEVIEYNPGDEFPLDTDIILGGGGQDSGQSEIQDDLLKIAPILKDLAEKNVPMLMICGLYQLFGDYFETIGGEKIPGIGLFSGLKTIGGNERMIGNIVTQSKDFGEIVGYENHSGQTFLSNNLTPLAKVILGAGNNPGGEFEGIRYKNIIGTYLHGSLLPKNPQISNFLIDEALKNQGPSKAESTNKSEQLEILNRLTNQAREITKKRPR